MVWIWVCGYLLMAALTLAFAFRRLKRHNLRRWPEIYEDKGFPHGDDWVMLAFIGLTWPSSLPVTLVVMRA